MKSLLIGLLLVSQTAFAGKLERDIQELSTLVDVGTNGGEAIVVKYDVKKFSYEVRVKNLLEDVRSFEGCSMQTAIGRNQVLKSSFASLPEEAQELLNKLARQGHLKAALGYYWSGDDGDSESCMRERLDLYFINGESLQINFDSTT